MGVPPHPPGLRLTTTNGLISFSFTSHASAGMSPNAYEVVLTPTKVKKCYGCGCDFADKYRSSPSNLIIKHVDRRVTRRDDRTGQLVYSSDFTNTYYHPIASHLQRKKPFSLALFISILKCMPPWIKVSVMSLILSSLMSLFGNISFVTNIELRDKLILRPSTFSYTRL